MPLHSNLGLKFRETARANAERPALRQTDGGIMTYAELDELSNRLARLLLERGLRRGDVIGIFHDKSPAAFAAMLACLKTGLIYTNLDPDSPWERLRKIILTCEPKAIVNGFTETPHAADLPQLSSIIIQLRHPATLIELQQHDPAEYPGLDDVTGAHPAYIMFTSGSTGIPKGAVMSHANVLSFVDWVRDRFRLTPEDILSNVNPMYFDNSVFDFYAALFSGASLVPVSSPQVREPAQLAGIINRAHCTVWFSVPSLLVFLLTTRSLSPGDFPSLRKIVFGGEGFPKAKLKQLYDLFGKRADLENVYGPTECTCICSAHTIVPEDFADMKALAPLGFLAPHFECEVLPTSDAPEAGELFLRGPGVGLGYYNDPDRTAQVFIQNPTHDRFADIGYRTGDLVRRETGGPLHFIGRTDFQIKHLGHRIELEEIEAALNSVAEVKECAVIYRRMGDGFGEILGFAALSRPKSPDQLIRDVARIIPPYMVPRHVTVLESLPKNASGKIDRVALQTVPSTAA